MHKVILWLPHLCQNCHLCTKNEIFYTILHTTAQTMIRKIELFLNEIPYLEFTIAQFQMSTRLSLKKSNECQTKKLVVVTISKLITAVKTLNRSFPLFQSHPGPPSQASYLWPAGRRPTRTVMSVVK